MIFEELVGLLSHCQVIDEDHELYPILAEISREDWPYLSDMLNDVGYNITFNTIEDCYVVY